MGTYYLDIETNGLDEVQNKIITIQYAELERGTGKQLGELTVLKEWELGEKEMLRKFIDDSPITAKYSFDFVPVGYNLGFEHKFLLEKSSRYDDLFPISILSRPCVDLRSIGILMNKGEFKGSGLDKLTGKKHSGSPLIEWYDAKKYDEIENYITNETAEFVKWYEWLHKEMPELRTKWETELN
ncbi:MAG: ribonuclease H-like domain-containing protein [Candidatus Nitrosopumilus sp. bin_6a]